MADFFKKQNKKKTNKTIESSKKEKEIKKKSPSSEIQAQEKPAESILIPKEQEVKMINIEESKE